MGQRLSGQKQMCLEARPQTPPKSRSDPRGFQYVSQGRFIDRKNGKNRAVTTTPLFDSMKGSKAQGDDRDLRHWYKGS
jgi:hypothetical protein